MRKLSKNRRAALEAENGTRILRKGESAAKKAENALSGPRAVPESTVLSLLDSHDELMGRVSELKGAMATVRVWQDLTFTVSRTADGMADRLEVKSAAGAYAMFHVARDDEGYIDTLEVIRSDPEISLTLHVVRTKDGVMDTVVTT